MIGPFWTLIRELTSIMYSAIGVMAFAFGMKFSLTREWGARGMLRVMRANRLRMMRMARKAGGEVYGHARSLERLGSVGKF